MCMRVVKNPENSLFLARKLLDTMVKFVYFVTITATDAFEVIFSPAKKCYSDHRIPNQNG